MIALHRALTSNHRLTVPGGLRVATCLLVVACTQAWSGFAGPRTNWERMAAIVPKGYVCYHTTKPMEIDGRLDEPDWQHAAWTDDFQDIEGASKARPRFRTHAKLLWDDEYLYVGAELEEPDVWGTLTNHDSVIFRDNDFEVFIDPNGDSHEYYEIEINALNTEWDLFLPKPYKDGGKPNDAWEIPGLKKAIHVEGTLNHPGDRDHGWSVELAFPWKVLGEFAHQPTPPREGDQWRVNFSRVEWRVRVENGRYRKLPGPEDNWVWSPQGIVDMHRPERWGYVQFSRRPFGQATFQPDPALAARNFLQAVYYAEQEYFGSRQHWATTLKELELVDSANPQLSSPELRGSAGGFEASVQLKPAGGAVERWHIRQDARIWRE